MHAESMPDDQSLRAQQFNIAVDTLCTSPTPVCALLGGDTNVEALDELRPILDRGFVDAFLAVHPDAAADDLVTFNATYAQASLGARHRKRLDFVFSSAGATPIEARLLGQEAYLVPGSGLTRPHPLGRDGLAYASDHLGVEIAFTLPSPRL